MRTALVTLTICLFVLPVQAKYSGGTGEPNDPYQIATAADLIALGQTPTDYDRHFILIADIDLSTFDGGEGRPALPTVGTSDSRFVGVFDGAGHTISHFSRVFVRLEDNGVGLFGCVGRGGCIRALSVADAHVTAEGIAVGGLAGRNEGTIVNCHVYGGIAGDSEVGGLVGRNTGLIRACSSTATVSAGAFQAGGLVGWNEGAIIDSHATGDVSGDIWVGGLVGENRAESTAVDCYATGTVVAEQCFAGGLAGSNSGTISSCYSTGSTRAAIDHAGGLVGYDVGGIIVDCFSTGSVSGKSCVGGLAGSLERSPGKITNCYSTGAVTGTDHVGGLVGEREDLATVTNSFWDVETSGQQASAGGRGKLSTEIRDIRTYLEGGWDFAFVDDRPGDVWAMRAQECYPVLWWQVPPSERPPLPAFSGGSGTPDDPYLISKAADLSRTACNPRLADSHFRLTHDVDVAGETFSVIGGKARPFLGRFDGDGHKILNLTLKTTHDACVGLFGYVAPGGRIENLIVHNVDVTGPTTVYVGAVVGWNSGSIGNCQATGAVSGYGCIGGIVGRNWGGTITRSCFSGQVEGDHYIGGLVGVNGGTVGTSWSRGGVLGSCAGGLAGSSLNGSIANCYSTCSVAGYFFVGGLVGYTASDWNTIVNCYSTGRVSVTDGAGGLIGDGAGGLIGAAFYNTTVSGSFWDIHTAGQTASACGLGKMTDQMQAADTFLEAGWDFVGETANGTADIWTICAGRDYPRLAWEQVNCADPNRPPKTVFYPDYVTLTTYGTRMFQWTYGRTGEWTSEVLGTLTVNYGDGSCRTATEISNTSFSQGRFWNEAAYNDGITTGMVALGDYWLSSDAYLTSYPSAWSFGRVTDGMRVDMSPYYLLRKDGMQPPARMEFRVNLYTVQDVNVLCGHYAEALILWSLDTRYPYVPLDFGGKDADLGLELPTASETAGYAVIGFRIRGWHADILALGGVDPQTGRLQYLGELKEIK